MHTNITNIDVDINRVNEQRGKNHQRSQNDLFHGNLFFRKDFG